MKNLFREISFRLNTPSRRTWKKSPFFRRPQTPNRKVFTTTRRTENFYLTTAIYYTNGPPHMGHAYEAICSDVIARYHRLAGRDVFFLTGADEHGQKIAQAAEAQNLTPQKLCDKFAGLFQEMNSRLLISNDFYIRTTSEKHEKFCSWIWNKALEAGDIYLGEYEGWYDVREEKFVTDLEAAQTDFKDKYGFPLQKMKEESYFFRLTKHQDKLIKHLEENPHFVYPEFRRAEIISRLQKPLTDLSISRTTFKWGIPVPNDPNHVMYVWFDALSNYLSAIDYPDGKNSYFWPADVHIIGQDIIWFHCVIWPCMLLSANIPLPRTVVSHGFINGPDGRKMSKSLGNVIDPNEMVSRYPVESFRYFLVREGSFGSDVNFIEEALVDRHNAELADNFGNLVHRAITLGIKHCGGNVPSEHAEADEIFPLKNLVEKSEEFYRSFQLQPAIELAFTYLRESNKWLTIKEPWKMKEDQNRKVAIRTLLEGIYILGHFCFPVLPRTCEELFSRLGTPMTTIPNLSWSNLQPGAKLTLGDVLFKKVEISVEPHQSLLLKVGKVLSVTDHPKADKLLVFQIDFGDETRQIISGIKDYYKTEELQGRSIVALCNLKKAKIRDLDSNGMLLTAENQKKEVKLLEPVCSIPGDFVHVDGKKPKPKGEIKKTELDSILLSFVVKNKKVFVGGLPLVSCGSAVSVEIEDGSKVL